MINVLLSFMIMTGLYHSKVPYMNPVIKYALSTLGIEYVDHSVETDASDIADEETTTADEENCPSDEESCPSDVDIAELPADANGEFSNGEDIGEDISAVGEAVDELPGEETPDDSESGETNGANASDWIENEITPVTIYPTTTVNVRSLPSTDGAILAQVGVSDTLTATAEVKSYKGQACFFYKIGDGMYISGDYASFEKTEPITGNYVPVVKEGIEYYTCGNVVTLPSGDYNINTNYIGLKVVWTNRALLGSTNAKYTADTVAAVSNLQNTCGLPVTGEVDLATWLAMGYSEDEWHNLGTYITPMKVSAGATHQQCVDAMIQTSIEYMNAGTDYRIGCSGCPGQYADCSGFIFQCLYSIGVNPTINIVDHALAAKEYTSRDLCADDRLGLPVSYEDMQVGDIIFYSSNGYNVTHVALYAGNGQMYDSNSGGVKLRNIWNRSTIVKIVRVCPD